MHLNALRDLGVYMIAALDLEALAADGVYEFAFIAAPLRLSRATGHEVERSVDRALSASDGHFNDSRRAMRELSVGDRLGGLVTPTLMIAGAADHLVRANVENYLKLPNAALHVFSRVGHGIYSEVPDALAEVIADFMANGVNSRLSSPAAASARGRRVHRGVQRAAAAEAAERTPPFFSSPSPTFAISPDARDPGVGALYVAVDTGRMRRAARTRSRRTGVEHVDGADD